MTALLQHGQQGGPIVFDQLTVPQRGPKVRARFLECHTGGGCGCVCEDVDRGLLLRRHWMLMRLNQCVFSKNSKGDLLVLYGLNCGHTYLGKDLGHPGSH